MNRTPFVVSEMHLSALRERSNERWGRFLGQENHFAKCFGKYLRHLSAAPVAGSKKELPALELKHGSDFQLVVTDSFVLGENDPFFLADFRKPDAVKLSSLEMRGVFFVFDAGFV
jgi:hypothetical protein